MRRALRRAATPCPNRRTSAIYSTEKPKRKAGAPKKRGISKAEQEAIAAKGGFGAKVAGPSKASKADKEARKGRDKNTGGTAVAIGMAELPHGRKCMGKRVDQVRNL